MKSKKIYSALMASALCATSIVPQVSIAFAQTINFNNQNYGDFNDAVEQFKRAWNAQDQKFLIYYFSNTAIDNSIGETIANEASKYTEDSLPTEGDYMKYLVGNWTMGVPDGAEHNILIDPNTNMRYATLQCTLTDYDSTMKSKEATLQSTINSIINSFNLPSNATEYQKVNAVYNWIKNNITANKNGGATPYDAAINHSANAKGTNLLAYRMLRQLGVSTRVVQGSFSMPMSSGSGIWLITKINGQYYHCNPYMGAYSTADDYMLNGSNSFITLSLNQESTEVITDNGYYIPSTKYVPTSTDLNPGSGGGTTTTEPINYSATINSYLKLHKDVAIPNLNVNYSVINGNADSSKDILAGINASNITIDSANFNNSLNKSTIGNNTVTLGTNEVYVQNSLKVTLTDMKFTAPGKYRYVITQSNISNSSITPANQSLIMDVSVSRNGDTYSIVNVTFSNGTSKVDGFVITDIEEPAPITKTYNLMVSNTTTGNGADLNKYFEYNVSISGLTPNKTYVVNGGSINTNPTVITANTNGVVNTTIWLKNGETITFNGLDENARYIITKTDASDNYTTTSSNNTNSQLTTNTTVTFTNSKGLNVDTGVVTRVAPFAFLSAMAMSGLAIFKKKKENN